MLSSRSRKQPATQRMEAPSSEAKPNQQQGASKESPSIASATFPESRPGLNPRSAQAFEFNAGTTTTGPCSISNVQRLTERLERPEA